MGKDERGRNRKRVRERGEKNTWKGRKGKRCVEKKGREREKSERAAGRVSHVVGK